jgi:dTDP-4-amino-4,6-dideoxygalactose transaminase
MIVNPTIPFFDVSTTNDAALTLECVSNVCERNWYILGEEVSSFESEFAAYNGSQHCISVANGTDALTLALKAVGVRQHDKVLLVANAGFYGSTAVHAVGAEPVYCDVVRVSRNMNPVELSKILDSVEIAAVIVTHLYGQPADIENIAALCGSHNIPLIEDCAQSHGAIVADRRVGSFGDVGCFSFYPTKNLGTVGDGGAVITSDETIAQTLRQLRQYGWDGKYKVALQGGQNSRLDEIQAAILRKKLPRLDTWNHERRQIAQLYTSSLSQLFVCPTVTDTFVAHLYVIQTEHRDALKASLASAGIATDIHYPIPDHHQPAYSASAVLPHTEELAKSCLSLPCYPGIPQHHVSKVIEQVSEFFKTL